MNTGTFLERLSHVEKTCPPGPLDTQSAVDGATFALDVVEHIQAGWASPDFLYFALGAISECGNGVLRGFLQELTSAVRESQQ